MSLISCPTTHLINKLLIPSNRTLWTHCALVFVHDSSFVFFGLIVSQQTYFQTVAWNIISFLRLHWEIHYYMHVCKIKFKFIRFLLQFYQWLLLYIFFRPILTLGWRSGGINLNEKSKTFIRDYRSYFPLSCTKIWLFIGNSSLSKNITCP